ncbi:MAG: response regulator [Rhodocyclaceae bacterium]|nr:response regulator [Rhodocyclaceae bacterium]
MDDKTPVVVAPPAAKAEFETWLKFHTAAFPLVAAYRAYDRAGRLIASSLGRLDSRRDISGDAYFRALRDAPANVWAYTNVVGGTALPSNPDGLRMMMARAVTDESGVFDGMVVAELDLGQIHHAFSLRRLGDQDLISLRRSDTHVLLARWPHEPELLNQSLPASHPLVVQLGRSLNSADMGGTLMADGVRRLVAYASLAPFPFYIAVGLNEEKVLTTWRDNARVSFVLTGLLLLCCGLLMLGIYRTVASLRQRDTDLVAAHETLDQLNQGLEARVVQRTAEVEERERLLAESQRQAHIGSWRWDLQQTIAGSDEAFRILGQPENTRSISLDTCFALLDAADAPRYKGWLDACRSNENPGVIDFKINLPDGSTRYVAIQGELGAITEGRPATMSGTVQDITLRRMADLIQAATQRERDNILQALNEHCLVSITDAGGKITFANEKFCAISKYSRAELVGQNHRILKSGVHPPEFFATFWATISRGNVVHSEVCNRAADGSFFWVNSTTVPFLGVKGKPVQYIAVRTDITARKQAEAELKRMAEEVARTSEVKETFLATMSHEIRTPLGGLLGMLELLAMTPLDAEQDDTLRTARDSGAALLRIVNDILDWSKITQGQLELAPLPVNLEQMLATVVAQYAALASAREVVLSKDIDSLMHPVVVVDSLRLMQVLGNLISNAIKFSRGGRVALRVRRLPPDLAQGEAETTQRLRFSVSDTGIGIPLADQHRLFQRYSQADASTARMYGGTGLGLAICKQLVNLMHGEIAVESAPGQGSTFSVSLTLPLGELPDSAEPGLAGEPAHPAPGSPAESLADATPEMPPVLVADDNEINRKLLARQLALLGCHADTAEDGQMALERWQSGSYALVITDCHMPVMDGYALTRQIRHEEATRTCPRTTILGWTANALPEEREKCMAAGMDDILVKPANLAQLKTALAGLASTEPGGPGAPRAPAPALLPATPAAPRAINIEVLAALVGDSPEVLRDFMEAFLVSAQKITVELGAACADGEAERAGALAHKLKSSALSVGAVALAEVCRQIEEAGNANQRATVQALHAPVQDCLAAVMASGTQLLDSWQATGP